MPQPEAQRTLIRSLAGKHGCGQATAHEGSVCVEGRTCYTAQELLSVLAQPRPAAVGLVCFGWWAFTPPIIIILNAKHEGIEEQPDTNGDINYI